MAGANTRPPPAVAGQAPGERAGPGAKSADIRELFEVIPDGLIVVDRSGTIVRANRQCHVLFGYEAGELIGLSVEQLLPSRLRSRHVRKRQDFQKHPSRRHMNAGLKLKGSRKDGSEIPVDIMLSPLGGGHGVVLAVVRDISTISRLNDDLFRLAYRDVLTDLPNRAALYEDLDRLIEAAKTKDERFSIVLFDLDKFKEVNDSLGHSCGDQLLRVVARRCRAAIRDDVRLYRLGGDEFVALLEGNGDPRDAATVASKLTRAIAMPMEIAGHKVHVSSSAGIALAPNEGRTISDLLANADLALYRAKSEGGNGHAFFQQSLRNRAVARHQLDSRLRDAMDEERFELYFQPTTSLRDRRWVGAEALLRWHENGRVIGPAVFVDTLETSPLADQVGSWILDQACRAAKRLRQAGTPDFSIAVNLFPSQFRDTALAMHVESALNQHGLDPEAIHLEITETIALANNISTLSTLHRLRDLGVGLAFDDFGTGFASLSFLTTMPLTHLKIDRSFVHELPASRSHAAVVKALIRMADELGLCVVAEGVENSSQEDYLREHGCALAQGFLFGHPVPLQDLEALLDNDDGRPIRAHGRLTTSA